MANGKVLGQNHITQHFENAIKMGKISHAYIINGEAESGKGVSASICESFTV